MTSRVLILDFGSQYTQLIARRIRELKVFCEILPCHAPLEKVRQFDPGAIVLSGGPASVYEKKAPSADAAILRLGVPILGICYGMQWLAHELGGKVTPGNVREYGPATIHILRESQLFENIVSEQRPERALPGRTSGANDQVRDKPDEGFGERAGSSPELNVWMSHGDHVTRLPDGFESYARSGSGLEAAIGDPIRRIFGLQFHPEVVHTPEGRRILSNFLFTVSGLKGDWSIESFVDQKMREIRETVGGGRVLCAVSGGVDSSVMAALIHRAVGGKLEALFIDNGLLRKGEGERVLELFRRNMQIPLRKIDASERFLKKLDGITDPEEKRKRIGKEFIEVFEEEARKLKGVAYLAQGTLYPDVIESVSFRGPSATIKSHHNVGGLPERMHLKLIEPFRELFKDEVRTIGRLIGVPDEITLRQPFPGPGLAVRILGEVTAERLRILREADEIVVGAFKKAALYTKVWQSFSVLLPVKTVGVMGDARTYENVIAIRAVESLDGMTADWVRLPPELLATISNRVINEVRGVNRVVYDISSKPPATIEWE